MENRAKIVLCIGTYIYQLSRFCYRNNRDSMPVKTKEAKNGNHVTDKDLLLTLLAVGHLNYQPPDMGDSFKTQTSDCINCKREIASIRDISSQLNKAVQDFNNDIRSEDPNSLKIVTQFVDCCKLSNSKQQLTEKLLYMIKYDETIADDASFYINGNGRPVSKAQLETIELPEN